MRYIPHTEHDIREMLKAVGVTNVEDLFQCIPEPLRLGEKNLNLPEALSESELVSQMQRLQKRNPDPSAESIFLGAGAYRHYAPALVDALISRGEFSTAYTPYQPEVSQGTLQAIFEFQTLVALLTGMEVANASMYDGASALAEAVLMAHRVNTRKRFLIARAVHPEYRQ
ncbi:MAG: glycine dehydrogenase, partial [Nitrospinae bacterium CG11_big_fil_rev_8_21_14_0_20_56_8]